MKMKADFLNCIISILLLTVIIPGTITGMASAIDGQLVNNDSEELNYSDSNSRFEQKHMWKTVKFFNIS
jgi:hypothetical protein